MLWKEVYKQHQSTGHQPCGIDTHATSGTEEKYHTNKCFSVHERGVLSLV